LTRVLEEGSRKRETEKERDVETVIRWSGRGLVAQVTVGIARVQELSQVEEDQRLTHEN
jgi:hypothetical protein